MADLVTLAEITCTKCGLFGCDCDKPRQATALHNICRVCRRNQVACICTSHVLPALSPQQQASELKTQIEGRANQAMRYYYDRDPQAIERMVRELAAKAYG